MAKSVHDNVLDAALNYLKNNVVLETVCTSQPTSYAEASATYKLADVAVDSADFSGPANGDSSGRKIQVNQQATITVDSSGSAQHVALCSSDTLLYVTTCTAQQLTQGNTVTIPAWDIEIADPS